MCFTLKLSTRSRWNETQKFTDFFLSHVDEASAHCDLVKCNKKAESTFSSYSKFLFYNPTHTMWP